MRTLRPTLLLLVVLGPVAPLARAWAQPPTPVEIDAAIERGVEWVLDSQKAPGAWGSGQSAVGRTALAALALLHCGLAEGQGTAASRRLARALAWLDHNGAGRGRRRALDTRTYEASLLLLVLRARGRPEDRPRMQRLADLLGASQARNGQWWYDGKGAPHIEVGDNSNTQFALLALGAAHGEGLRVPSAVWKRARAWWERASGKQGGFGYASGGSPKSAATGSMTAAGIACLAILDTILGPPAPTPPTGPEDPDPAAVRARALAFLAEVFSVKKNHGPTVDRRGQRQRQGGRGWLHYYLWTVERALVLSEQPRLGSRDWYAEGVRQLLDTQQKDGSWRQEHPLYATCFALLFLTRAADPPRAFTPSPSPPAPGETSAPVTPGAQPPPAPAPAREDPAPGMPAAGAVAPGTVAQSLREALPPGEAARRCRRAGPGCLAVLVTALQDPDRAVRQRAFEVLTEILGPERVARADRHPLPRGRLALWVRREARHLVLRDGRFVIP